MNTQDFNLLTKEEIDSVVADVLSEQGLSLKEDTAVDPAKRKKVRDFQKRQGFEVGSAGMETPEEKAQSDARRSARATKDADAELSGLTDQDNDGVDDVGQGAGAPPAQTGAQQGGTGGTAPKAGTGVQTGTGRGQGFSGNATMPDDDVVRSDGGGTFGDKDAERVAGGGTRGPTMPGNSGVSADGVRQGASNRTQAQEKGFAGDQRLGTGKKKPTSIGTAAKDAVGAIGRKFGIGKEKPADPTDPDQAAAAQQGDDATGRASTSREAGAQVNMTGNWFEPGTSNMPSKITSRVSAAYGDEMFSVNMALGEYLKAMGFTDERQLETSRRHYLGYFRGLMKQIDKHDGPDGNPELVASAEMEVKRAMDNLLNTAAKRGGNSGGGGGGETPPDKETPPGEVLPPEREVETSEDDKGDPIPINKFPPRKKDEDGNPVDGKRAQPLRSKLSKAGLNPQVINTVMRAITKQLTAQDVPFTESMKKQVASLVIERLLVKEIKNIMLSEKGNPDDFTGQKDTPLTRPKRTERPDQAVNGKYFKAWLKKLRKKSGINFEPTAVRSAVDRVLAKAIGPTVGISEAATEDPSVIRYTDLHKALMKVPYAGEQEGTLSADEADKLGKLIMNALQKDPKIAKQANIRFEMPGDGGEDDEPEKEDIPDELTIQNTDTWGGEGPVDLNVGYDEKDPEPEPGPEHHKYGQVPDLFKKYWDKLTKGGKSRVGDMSAEEAWKNLPSGKEGKKRQNVAESLLSSQELLHFAKLANLLEARVNPRASGADDNTVMPKTGQGRGTSRKDLDRSVDKFGQGRKPAKAGYGFDDPEIGAGSDDYEITKASFFSLQDDEKHSEMRSFVGALVNKLAQNVKGRDASKGGFGGDTFKQARGEKGGGTIKMSTMNQQLKANGVDRKVRKQVMGLVQKHIQPYLKQHNIKLSESQVEQIFGTYVDKLLKERSRAQD